MDSTTPDLSLQRSVLLALWLSRTAPTRTSVTTAVQAVQHEDEPHTVTGAAAGPHAVSLREVVGTWSGGPLEVCAALPRPGDPAGVPAPAAAAAIEAGECLLVHTPAGAWAAIPRIQTFGSALEEGHLVEWSTVEVGDWRPGFAGVVGSAQQAEAEMREALVSATQALRSLDVARWRPDAAQSIEALRTDAGFIRRLPAGLDQRTVRILTTAVRLRAIVELARMDDGAAVNTWQTDQRSAALQHIERVSRRALSAASHAAAGEG